MEDINNLLFPDRDFGVSHTVEEQPNVIDFAMHNHDGIYEITLVICGDCEFRVEGNSYRLQPNDIVFANPTEFHGVAFRMRKPYESISLYISEEYFVRRDCLQYRDIFCNKELGVGNVFKSDNVGTEIADAVRKLLEYADAEDIDAADNEAEEILRLLDLKKEMPRGEYTHSEYARDIIEYINNHLTDDLSVAKLANMFFISKPFMSKLFKDCTGDTINRYINAKRIMLTEKIQAESGVSYSKACTQAGYKSYANFYKAYISVKGHSPSGKE